MYQRCHRYGTNRVFSPCSSKKSISRTYPWPNWRTPKLPNQKLQLFRHISQQQPPIPAACLSPIRPYQIHYSESVPDQLPYQRKVQGPTKMLVNVLSLNRIQSLTSRPKYLPMSAQKYFHTNTSPLQWLKASFWQWSWVVAQIDKSARDGAYELSSTEFHRNSLPGNSGGWFSSREMRKYIASVSASDIPFAVRYDSQQTNTPIKAIRLDRNYHVGQSQWWHWAELCYMTMHGASLASPWGSLPARSRSWSPRHHIAARTLQPAPWRVQGGHHSTRFELRKLFPGTWDFSTYLSASLKADSLQFRATAIKWINEVPEQRNVFFTEKLEIITVDVWGKIGMCHFIAEAFHLLGNPLDRLKKVNGNKMNPRIDPVVWKWSTWCDDYFRPFHDLLVNRKNTNEYKSGRTILSLASESDAQQWRGQ